MDKIMLTPKEISYSIIEIGCKKAAKSINSLFLLGILAGMYISFGAVGATIMMATVGDKGLAKLAGASVFPVGLMLVLMAGGELFTGNCLMTLGLIQGRYGIRDMLKNWITVYLGNLVGALSIAFIISKAGLYNGIISEKAIAIAEAKANLTLMGAVFRGILCNIIVVLAVWLASGAKDAVSKMFACWFPVMLFVLSGYEHSIANMFFIPVGKFLGLQISWGQIWFNNIIPVTIGNIIGGAVIIPIIYYSVYVKEHKSVYEKEHKTERIKTSTN